MAASKTLALALLFCTVRAAAQTADETPPPPPPAEDADNTPDAPPQGDAPQGDAPPAAPSDVPPVAPAPSRPVDTSEDDISLEEWNRDDWMLVKPKVSLIDVDGYFRVRGDMLNRLDFDNQSATEFVNGQPYSRFPDYGDGHANYTNTNMRLRIEPRINITEQAQVMATVDFLDNLVLGSTPDAVVPGMTRAPVAILSRSQKPVRNGQNALVDAIAIKRVWGRVTALNEQLELKIGRMPDHWGLGMLYNNGDCLDCDYGTVADRAAISFRIYNHIFTPMASWIGRGLQFRPFGYWDPMPQEAGQWADTMEYALRIMREDHPEDVRDAVTHGKQVVNYGLANAFRFQARDFIPAAWGATNSTGGYSPANAPPAVNYWTRRDAFLYVGDLYGKLFTGNWELLGEYAVEAGAFTDEIAGKTQVLKMGGALEGKYHFRGDFKGVTLGLKAGGASGDVQRGFGVLDQADTQRVNPSDTALRNFQFSPDYHLDLLLFRRILGAVTDAWYLRPEVFYRFDERVAGRVNAVYSQAMRATSTSAARSADPQSPLGVEIDAEVMYGLDTNLERGQFMASLAGGMLFPLGGFNNASLPAANQGGSFAWTVQARVFFTY